MLSISMSFATASAAADATSTDDACVSRKNICLPLTVHNPPAPPASGSRRIVDAIALKKHHKLFKYSLLVHTFGFKKEQEKGRYICTV